jgi:hypothetical protein
MKSISELKEERQAKNSELFEKVGLFFAFSDEQFQKNKTPLKDGEKYVAIGAGGYLPKGNVDEFLKGMEEINDWYKGEIKSNKAENKEIVYELNNHECFYTNDLTSVYELFEGVYTKEQIKSAYIKEIRKEHAAL